jgi:lipopolysaccharide/colanic/teichoic acid biosynthesis glycosyltransferase
MRLGNQQVPIVIGDSAKGSEVVCEDTIESYCVPIWKRVLDTSCIVLALPILLPVVLVLSLLIKLLSPGPVLFLSERVGFRGRRFICFKFRTMKVNADVDVHKRHLAELMRSDAPMVKIDAHGDPRLIRFGSVLRATGLDELPQLLNVLAGEMSLVGPRPCLPYEYDGYLPSQKRRFNSLPGLTGLWQVSGKNKTTFSEMIALDIRYAENKSLWMDLTIMFKTFPALFAQVAEARHRRKKAGRPVQEQKAPTNGRNGHVLLPTEFTVPSMVGITESRRCRESLTASHAED